MFLTATRLTPSSAETLQEGVTSGKQVDRRMGEDREPEPLD